MNKHALRYIRLAKEIASWSRDPSSKVGAVAVGDKGQILSQGYNGLPRGIADTEERIINRELKYHYVVHAESNCIYNSCHNGVSLNGAELYVYGLPVCSECAKGIIQVGIKEVYVSKESLNKREEWKASWDKSVDMLHEAGITTFIVDDTNESISNRPSACTEH